MKNYLAPKNEQLKLLEVDQLQKYPAKRVNIVSLKLVKENSSLSRKKCSFFRRCL